MQPIIYLPIEIKTRELPSRLLMASRFHAAGYAVVVGNQWSLIPNLIRLPHGLVFFKTMNKIQGDWMAGARAAGHLVAANDEEVLNFINSRGYLFSFDISAATHCHMFFAQSDAHARAVTDHFPVLAGKTHVVGNPRLDLLALRRAGKFMSADDPMVAQLKPYLLVNTNYGSINSIWGDDQRFYAVNKRAGAFAPPNAEQKIKDFWDVIAWEKGNYEAMRALLDWMLPRLGGIKIVIRPHPIERAELWSSIAAQHPNVVVVRQSEPHPWIMGAELVVHTGCTTGLEAVLLGRPTLNLLPRHHPYAQGLVELTNPTFHDWQQAAAALKQFMVHRTGPIAPPGAAAHAALAEHLPSYQTANAIDATVRIALDALSNAGVNALEPGNSFDLDAYERTNRADLAKAKFSVTLDEFSHALNWAAQTIGNNRPIRIKEMDESVFLTVPA